MDKAICWELSVGSNCAPASGYRFAVVGPYLLAQPLLRTNQRPVWTVTVLGDPQQAAERALLWTEYLEKEYGAALVVQPGEIIVHEAEKEVLAQGRIQPALRARIFTSCSRRREQP